MNKSTNIPTGLDRHIDDLMRAARLAGQSTDDAKDLSPLDRGFRVGESVRTHILGGGALGHSLIMASEITPDNVIGIIENDMNIGIVNGLELCKSKMTIGGIKTHLEQLRGSIIMIPYRETTPVRVSEIASKSDYLQHEIEALTPSDPELLSRFPIPETAIRFSVAAVNPKFVNPRLAYQV